MYKWNPVFNLVMEIKEEYKKTFDELDTYHFETWLTKLNNKKYNDIFECLQINQDNEFILIRYGLAEMQEGMWIDENSIYRECRSIVIDLKNEEIVLSPFRKFFNLNEVNENKLEKVIEKFNSAKVVEVANKLDGSMQNARWYKGKVFMAGSMALNQKESWRLQDGYSMLTDNYLKMLKENQNYTFIFEYISLKDAHVVLYKKEDEGLYLIGMRNTLTGEQVSYSKVIEIAKKYNVKVVSLENKNIDTLLDEMKKFKSYEKEGWVLNLYGHYIKIKCDDYVYIHRLLDKVSSVNVVIQSIAEEKFDDLLSKIPDKYKKRVNKIAKLIFDYLRKTKQQIKEYYNEAPKDSRKDFMIWVDQNVPHELKHYVRCEYLGKEYHLIKKMNGGYKKLSEMGIQDDYSALFANVGEENE
mgnify:FL=1